MAWRWMGISLSQLVDSQCLLQPCQPIQTQEISYVVQDEGYVFAREIKSIWSMRGLLWMWN